MSSCHGLFIVLNFHFGEKWEFKFCGFLASFDDLFYFEACVSLVPLAVLLYCYVTYCPGKFCKSGCSFYFICSKELDRECDLVNVIVFLDWLVRSAHFFWENAKVMFAVFARVLWFLFFLRYVFLKVTYLLLAFLIKAFWTKYDVSYASNRSSGI
jgi:hypothetical protein